ncbi:ABC transporter transmembrane domain-containing protein [Amycolatopsis antarctica]|uniref:ABC transporter transmembrane domain-containing protein n=1 Tax=Amycolatopsis antarctica TaxID=1854586 RepID=UPI001F0ADA87|nr:ABC transporter ATP-binding protein [Amycolatopsis antarctica]
MTAPTFRPPARLTPLRYLTALLRARPWVVVSAAVFGALWSLPGAALPIVAGKGVQAIADGDSAGIRLAVLLVLLLGLVQAGAGGGLSFSAHTLWIHGATGTQRAVAEHAAGLGATLRGAASTGDVVAISGADVNHIGNALEVLGRAFGSVLVFLGVGVVLLTTSPLLGLVALLGVPLAVLGVGPLLAPLQRRKAAQREQLTDVTSLGADIVSGLRVLRGIGGERRFLGRFRTASQRVRVAGGEVGRSEAWLAAAEVALPGLVTIAITWLGARLALDGAIGVGDLVAFYGASAFLVVPVGTAIEAANAISSGLVAARKPCAVLALRPALPEPDRPVDLPPGPLDLHDSATGITAVAGKLTVIDAGPDAEVLADRLTRFAEPDAGEHVLVGGVRADRVRLKELRSRVVHAHNQDLWFSGILGEQVAPDRVSGVTVAAALDAADAGDIVDALPDGVGELIGERGREVSGGQRQRLSLARALATDADVLVLDEPTSAVDAHTEARIIERVAELRRGRTTVVFSQSPLWTSQADDVVVRREVTP